MGEKFRFLLTWTRRKMNRLFEEPMHLTDRQRDLLDYYQAHIAEHGCPPTARECCRRFDWQSPNAWQCHIRPLVRKGVMRKLPGKRGFVPVVDTEAILTIWGAIQ